MQLECRMEIVVAFITWYTWIHAIMVSNVTIRPSSSRSTLKLITFWYIVFRVSILGHFLNSIFPTSNEQTHFCRPQKRLATFVLIFLYFLSLIFLSYWFTYVVSTYNLYKDKIYDKKNSGIPLYFVTACNIGSPKLYWFSMAHFFSDKFHASINSKCREYTFNIRITLYIFGKFQIPRKGVIWDKLKMHKCIYSPKSSSLNFITFTMSNV